MIKRLCLALAGLFCVVSLAQGAGTVPGFSLTPQFDLMGKVAPGCKLYIIQAGTTSTPQNAYQDSGLSIPQPNPMTCDAAGRLSQFFVADGVIKLRLTTSAGTQIFVGDNLLVVGSSSGGGGGGTVDPTTIFQTGQIIPMYGTGVLTGFVRANGRTIGSATSGATERANSDAQSLFQYLWGADANLAVSGGRGASANADWVANKTLTLPDSRGRALAGLDDMGNSAAGRLTAAFWGSLGGCSSASPTTLGSACGSEKNAGLVTANLPPYTPAGSFSGNAIPGALDNLNPFSLGSGATPVNGVISQTAATPSGTFTGTPQGGTSTSFAVASPSILTTIYLKL